jgi:predicted permease
MLIIGIRLAEIDFPSVKATLRDKYVWLALSLRHFLMPVLMFAALKLLSLLFPISQTAILVITILTSAPVATATVMFSERYDSDAKYSSKIVTVSTLLSILTMPLVILLTEI